MSRLAHPIMFVQDPIPVDIDDPVRELGRKGVSLRRLAEAGHRVPRGFTIHAEVCRRFLANDGTWPEAAWDSVVSGIKRLESETGLTFSAGANSDGPPHSLKLAVRSGAGESMPGLLETILDVGVPHDPPDGRRSTSQDTWQALRCAIERVFHSWNDEQARDYRTSREIDHSLGTAVNVQEMIDCSNSGILFTRSPEPDGADRLTIEAVPGLGDKLLAGRSDPDRWTVPRDQLHCISFGDDSRQPPPPLRKLLPELCRIAISLEELFGGPLDLEWGIDKSGLVFFQARVIRCTAAPIDGGDVLQRQCDRLSALAAEGARVWVRHNLDQTLSYPTPLTWSLWRRFMSGSGGLGTLYRRCGYRPARRIAEEGFLELIGGRIFADPDRATRMFGDGFPFQYDPESLRADPSGLDHAPTNFDPDQSDPWLLWRLPVYLMDAIRIRRRLGKLFDTAVEVFEQQVVPDYLESLSRQSLDLSTFEAPELLELFESCRKLVLDQFAPESLLPGMLGAIAYADFERRVVRVLGTQAGRSLARELVPAGDAALIKRQQELLAACRSSPAKMATFLDEFGHRAIGEMELANPRWRETPELIAQLARNHAPQSPKDPVANPACQSYAAAVERLREAFTSAGGRSLVSDVEAVLERCWKFLPYRDRGKHLFLKGYELLREVTEALSERFGLGKRFYQLTIDEWPELARGTDFTQVIAERQQEARVFRRWSLPDIIAANDVNALHDSPVDRAGPTQVFEGTPLVGGQATGQVWNGATSLFIDATSSHHVLVCQSLEPALGPLLGRLSAVVVEQGGTLSHGAILARQWDLPVVRLPRATRLLSSGQSLQVDGNSGRIKVIEDGPS